MRKVPRKVLYAVTAGSAAAVLISGSVFAIGRHTDVNVWPYRSTKASAPVLAAVGDIGCEPNTPENSNNPTNLKCGGEGVGGFAAEYATANEVERMRPNLVALLGDEQYQVGKLSDFQNSFDKTYGAFKFLQRPAPGNHEYYAYTKHGDAEGAQNGSGYFAYYNGQSGDGSIRPHGQAGSYNKGWYSYDLGKWHIISLNAECDSDAFGHNCNPGTGAMGQETRWLARDLRSNHDRCTLAYWHQPTFTASGDSGDGRYAKFASNEGGAADTWWKLLYRGGADVVLNGHEHVYARFRPQDPSGNVDRRHGITQFTVGTGGEDLDSLSSSAKDLRTEHVVTGEDTAYGAMKLTLNRNSYHWSFRPVKAAAGQGSSALSYVDSGSARCHGPA